MIVQLSEAVIIRSERRFWQIKPRWRLIILDDDGWKPTTAPLCGDDMLQTLIEWGYPPRLIGFFVEALNSPGKYPLCKGKGTR